MTITLHVGDLPAGISFSDCVAIDTESMGLNWNRDRLCLIQLSSGDGNAHLVQFLAGQYEAPNLKKMLTDPKITKLFHFARADLATIYRHLEIMPQPVYCTKIASVLVRTFSERHSLKDLTRDLLGIELSKEQQTSDWGAPVLSQEQQTYAASDVLYLHKMKTVLDARLAREKRTELARKVMDCLPARAELDVAGWSEVDIFSHKPIRRPD
jgi:ribonuclease D